MENSLGNQPLATILLKSQPPERVSQISVCRPQLRAIPTHQTPFVPPVDRNAGIPLPEPRICISLHTQRQIFEDLHVNIPCTFRAHISGPQILHQKIVPISHPSTISSHTPARTHHVHTRSYNRPAHLSNSFGLHET